MYNLNLNLNDPIIISIAVLIISFLLSTLFLYIFNPKFVQIVGKNRANKRSKNLIILFSSFTAFIIAATSLLLSSQTNTLQNTSFNFSKKINNFSL